jgi:hypothetical protein
LIHSGGVLDDERARQILRVEFDSRKVDDVNWSLVIEAFRNGRSAVISTAQLRERYFPVAANDKPHPSKTWNETLTLVAKLLGAPAKERFQVTWFDDVDQSTAKEEILHGVLGAGEFSLFVAKPGTGKSVLVGDIGCLLRLAWIGMAGRSNRGWSCSSLQSARSYMPEDVPHAPYNQGTAPCKWLVVPSSGSDQDGIILLPELDLILAKK